jgi:hypothetical protein
LRIIAILSQAAGGRLERHAALAECHAQ